MFTISDAGSKTNLYLQGRDQICGIHRRGARHARIGCWRDPKSTENYPTGRQADLLPTRWILHHWCAGGRDYLSLTRRKTAGRDLRWLGRRCSFAMGNWNPEPGNHWPTTPHQLFDPSLGALMRQCVPLRILTNLVQPCKRYVCSPYLEDALTDDHTQTDTHPRSSSPAPLKAFPSIALEQLV